MELAHMLTCLAATVRFLRVLSITKPFGSGMRDPVRVCAGYAASS